MDPPNAELVKDFKCKIRMYVNQFILILILKSIRLNGMEKKK